MTNEYEGITVDNSPEAKMRVLERFGSETEQALVSEIVFLRGILTKLSEGDFSVWLLGQPGVGLDYSWVDLTPAEAQYLVNLGATEERGV